MMNGLQAYKYYMALKLHFTSEKFNVFENRGKINCSNETFNVRKDKLLFEKLSRKYPIDKEYIQYIASNFMYGNDSLVYCCEEADEVFFEWKRRKESITKVFSDDCYTILQDAESKGLTEADIFNFTLNTYPSIIRLYLGDKITIESLRIIDDLNPFLGGDSINRPAMVLIEKEMLRIKKSSGFIKYNKDRVLPVYDNFKRGFKELNQHG